MYMERYGVTLTVPMVVDIEVGKTWGEKKATIVKEAVQGPVNDIVSASYLQEHNDARFFLDTPAASAL